MIKAVLIDDERPALRGLEVMLKNFDDVELVGSFSDPFKAIEKVDGIRPDVIFLDINMPQLKGIDAASVILDNSPDTEIVFVTAYDEYAVKAFEINALDYLLKPVSPERLKETLNRVRFRTHKKVKSEAPLPRLVIRCFGSFEVYFEGKQPVKWRAEKTKELFAYFLHNAQREISKDEILDSLWQNDEPEKAVKQLYNGIYYIRKAMADYGIDRKQLSIDRHYNLRLGDVSCDKIMFNLLFKQRNDRIEALSQMDELYKGDYMGALPYEWAVIERGRLLDVYICCATELSRLYMQKKMYHEAASVLKKAYQKDPLSENVTQLLLMLYKLTGNKHSAVRHYAEYCRMLKMELSVEPAETIKRLSEWF